MAEHSETIKSQIQGLSKGNGRPITVLDLMHVCIRFSGHRSFSNVRLPTLPGSFASAFSRRVLLPCVSNGDQRGLESNTSIGGSGVNRSFGRSTYSSNRVEDPRMKLSISDKSEKKIICAVIAERYLGLVFVILLFLLFACSPLFSSSIIASYSMARRDYAIIIVPLRRLLLHRAISGRISKCNCVAA